MRMIVPTLKEAYFVHRTFNEYLVDTGENPLEKVDYEKWIDVLLSDKHRYVLLMHGRSVIGMTWGRECMDGFLVEGRFLRKAYRGKFKFSKKLLEAKVEMTKGYDKVKEKRFSVGKRKVKAYIV